MVLRLCSLHIFVCVIMGVSSQFSEHILKVSDGEIKGRVELYSGVRISAFKGIPYAKPPIGPLRLKEPEKPEGWTSTRDATSFGEKCPQLDKQGNMIGKEDCLFINVYTPLLPSDPSSIYPVMVFIHGDNFQRGSSNQYGPERFVDNNNNKIVLVTFNYRIGVLGFLSTGDDACPGNLGLKDQLLVLQWVRDNIKVFGGDTSSITLFGQGAGAASVFLHIISPESRDLFHRAITQSGSPLCDWAVEEEPYDHAVKIARRLGCSVKSTKAIADCIRDKRVDEILEAQKKEDSSTFGGYPMRNVPVVEKNGFLPESPMKLVNAGNFKLVPLLSGINKDDGSIFYPLIMSQQEKLKRNSSFLLNELIPMFLLNATDIRGNIEAVSQALYFQYFNDIDPTNISQVLQPFINMTTDAMFVSCNYKTIQSYSSKGARVYMYTFEYKGEHSMLEVELGRKIDYKGVAHGDELLYLFNIDNYEFQTGDAQMTGQVPYMWANFARTGESPISLFPKLESYTQESRNYLKIDKIQTAETSFRQREVNLWLHHLPKLAEIKTADKNAPEYKVGGFGWAMLAIALILLIVAAALTVLLLRKTKSQYFETKMEEK